jgi:integrase
LTGTHRHAGTAVHVANHGVLSYRGGSLLGKALEKLAVVGFSFLQHGFKSRRGHWKNEYRPALMALIRRGTQGIWKRTGRPNYFAWVKGRQVNLGTPIYADALKEWHRLSGTQPARERADRLLVVTLLNRFLVHLREDGRSDYGWYRSRVRSFAASIPKHLTLDQLKPSHVSAWIKGKDWSPTHKAGSISAVQRALNWHWEEGNIKRNPLAKLRKPKRTRREFVYSQEQLCELLCHLRSPARDFFVFVAASGCRPSELAAANGSDVSPDGATIAVRKSKTGNLSPMPVPESLRSLLRRHADKAGSGPLFSSSKGGRWNRTTWGRALTAARKAAGLPEDADAYALRHTWATERLKEGWSPADVALAMRTSVSMVCRVYGHLLGDRTRGLADRLG